jgi:heme-degrading monooxygenase HmoA
VIAIQQLGPHENGRFAMIRFVRELSSTWPLTRSRWGATTTGKEDMVIVRAWHATATAEGADAYREHFNHSVLLELRRIDGYQGAYLLRRGHDSQVELQVLTVWDSLEAIRRFAGANLDNAVVEPDAQAVLASYDPTVTHYTVVVDTVGAHAPTDK